MRNQDTLPHRLAAIRRQLSAADSLLDQGLVAINQGRKLEAMEGIYAASCLIGEIEAALDANPAGVESRTLCRET